MSDRILRKACPAHSDHAYLVTAQPNKHPVIARRRALSPTKQSPVGATLNNIGEKRIAGRGKPQGGLQCRRRGEASADEAWDRSGGCTADASPVRGLTLRLITGDNAFEWSGKRIADSGSKFSEMHPSPVYQPGDCFGPNGFGKPQAASQ